MPPPPCDVPRGGAGVYGPSPWCLAACCNTAFLAGVILGTESSASLVGELEVVAGGGLEDWPAPPAPNLELRFENHDGFLDNDGLPGEEPLLDSLFLDSRVKPGFGGMGLGWAAAFPFGAM